MKKHISLICLCMSLALSSCTFFQKTEKVPRIIITEDNNGEKIQVDKGTVIEIILEGNITTGFSWEIDSVEPALLDYSSEPEYTSGKKSLTQLFQQKEGTPGEFHFIFTAIETGECHLRLIYHQSFSPGTIPLNVFYTTLDIH